MWGCLDGIGNERISARDHHSFTAATTRPKPFTYLATSECDDDDGDAKVDSGRTGQNRSSGVDGEARSHTKAKRMHRWWMDGGGGRKLFCTIALFAGLQCLGYTLKLIFNCSSDAPLIIIIII